MSTARRVADRAWYLIPGIIAADPGLMKLPKQAAQRAVRLAEEIDEYIHQACQTSNVRVTQLVNELDAKDKEIDSLRLQLSRIKNARPVP